MFTPLKIGPRLRHSLVLESIFVYKPHEYLADGYYVDYLGNASMAISNLQDSYHPRYFVILRPFSITWKLLPDDSAAVRIIGLAEERNIFMWAGCLSFVGLAPFGVMTFFFLDTLDVVRGINVVAGASTFVGVSILQGVLGEKPALVHLARLLLLRRSWVSCTQAIEVSNCVKICLFVSTS